MKKTSAIIISLSLLLLLLLLPAAAWADGEDGPPADALQQARLAALESLDRHVLSMRDEYCVYYDQDQYRLLFDEYAGAFGGVGISMIQEGDYVTVYQVLSSGPAKDSPIRAGDRLLAADGESLVGLSTEQAALHIRGEVGTAVTLTLLNGEDEEYTVTLIREQITSTSLKAELIEEAERTAYFLIYDFTGQTAQEFRDEYNRLREEGPIDWIVIDLRSNVGGNFFAALGVAEYFVPQGQVLVREKIAGQERAYTSSSGSLQGLGLAVLENEWTASASEVLAGALRDQAGAFLIGTTSYGKGITQVFEPLPSGSCWKYTRSRYFTPSGFDLHGVGLSPDQVVEAPQGISSEEYFSTDPALNPHLGAAVEYIRSQS